MNRKNKNTKNKGYIYFFHLVFDELQLEMIFEGESWYTGKRCTV